MKHDPVLHRALHPQHCTCRRCHRPAPSDRALFDPDAPLTANEISARVLAGLATGLTLAQLHAWLTGSPGVPAMFGF